MKVEGKTVKRLVRLLTDPVCNFVSLVNHGANQTPFRVVKQADIQALKEAREEVIKESSSQEFELSRPSDQAQVMAQRIEFDKTHFDSERVTKYLSTLGFVEYKLSEEENQIVAKSNYFDQFDENVGRIEVNDPGVRMFVGTLKSGDDVEENNETVKKSIPVLKGMDVEQVQKFDEWVAYWTEAKDLGAVLQEALWDGMPPGVHEINTAFWAVIANAVRDNDSTAIRSAASELGDLIVALMDVVNKFSSSSNVEQQKMAEEIKDKLLKEGDKPADEQAPAEEGKADEPAANAEGAEGDDAGQEAQVAKEGEEQPSEEAAPKEGEPAADTAGPAADDAAGSDAEQPADEEGKVEKTAAPNEDLLTSIGKMMDEKFTALKAEIQKESQEVAERVSKLEGTATERRGVEVTDEESGNSGKANAQKSEEGSKVFKAEDPVLRNMLGL